MAFRAKTIVALFVLLIMLAVGPILYFHSDLQLAGYCACDRIRSPKNAVPFDDTLQTNKSTFIPKELQETTQQPTRTSAKLKTFLLVVIISAPKYSVKRNAIRDTWRTSYLNKTKQFTVRFIMGGYGMSDEDRLAIEKEQTENQDIVLLEDHLESYNNLTRKVLHTFLWVDQNVQYSYLLKVDDDSFAKLDTIEGELLKRSPGPLYWGWITSNETPKRSGPWKEDKWSICNKYIPYAFGGGYVLSSDLVHRLAVNADGLIMYNNEDVAVGAWVSPYRLQRKHDARFGVTPLVQRKCREDYLILHYQNAKNVLDIHRRLINGHKICS